MVKDLSIAAEKRGLKLIFESDSEIDCMVEGDKEKLRQVVLNFIDNSIDPSDFRSVEDESVVPNGRAEINDAFEYEMMPSSRTETWSRNHTFTLAEAFFVCGAESP
jgi:nitrogen-specific signal transduction histidine kinase